MKLWRSILSCTTKVEVNTIVKFKDSTSKDVKSIPQKGSKEVCEFIEHSCDIVVAGSMISDDTDRWIECIIRY